MSPDEINPYQAPQVEAYVARGSDDPIDQWMRKVKRFRQQMHALGGLWIIAGVLNGLLLTGLALDPLDFSELTYLLIGAGVSLLWLLVAVATFAKRLGGVSAGLALTTLISVFAVVVFPTIFLVMFAPITFGAWLQGQRVLRWAAELRTAGIPLTVRPEDVPNLLRPIEISDRHTKR